MLDPISYIEAKRANKRIDDMQETDANAEVISARKDTNNVTHNNLKGRLDSDYDDLSTQIENIETGDIDLTDYAKKTISIHALM